jgi:Exo-beta-D-glucosaminidase Ig-fold domain/Glycosyl hydrolases family 2/Glycosyl hydrolases family 2, TIM barrel domain/Glycosyl hydrolases family 2, sugar binding domain
MKKYLFIVAYITFISISNAQTDENPANKGLKQPQPSVTLPKSRQEIIPAILKEKQNPNPSLKKGKDNQWIVSGGWEMLEAEKLRGQTGKQLSSAFNTNSWYNATVPGTVLTTLVDQGVYPDPLWGLNNLSIPDSLCRMNWWYRTEINDIPIKKGEKAWLVFEGINYETNLWFNGQYIGNIKGAFLKKSFDVTRFLKGKNYLAVQIIPPPNPGIPHEQSGLSPKGHNGGALANDGPTFMCAEGWDWIPGIRDRNIGIWQDVKLQITGDAKLVYPQIITDLPLPDTSYATIRLNTEIECSSKGNYTLELAFEDRIISKKVSLTKGKNNVSLSEKEFKELVFKNPKLWWPNGYGEPNLYDFKITLKDANNKISDIKTIRTGVREMSYTFEVSNDQAKNQQIEFNPLSVSEKTNESLFDNLEHKTVADGITIPKLIKNENINLLKKIEGDNPYLVIKVNGIPIFCKGGNWGMDDAMKRVSRERLEPYFKLHKDANYTMIRNWVGQSTEEVFYDLADEYGLLVWNDFWMATEGYNLPPGDFDLLMENATDVVKHYRNHPSIAIWCSRNEGYAPKKLEEQLTKLIASEDPTRKYQSNSRELNLRQSGPWHYVDDVSYYFDKIAEGFSTEVGTLSFPTAESMLNMMSEKDAWPISDSWYYHDLHTGHEEYRSAIIRDYAESYNLEDFSKKAQMINYNSHRAIFEAWNSKLWDNASGVLLWMTHPAWPSVIWQAYSSDYETNGSYFGTKKACEPIHIQLNANNQKVVAINTSLVKYDNLKVNLYLLDDKGNKLFTKSQDINLEANAKKECFTFEIPEALELPRYTFTKLELLDNEGKVLSDNLYWDSRQKSWNNMFYGFNELQNVELDTKCNFTKDSNNLKARITIKNPSNVAAIALKLNLGDSKTGERVLPAFFSDGYFTLFPGEEKIVQMEFFDNSVDNQFYVSVEGYNVQRQRVENFKKP